jgi:hypothetical protein
MSSLTRIPWPTSGVEMGLASWWVARTTLATSTTSSRLDICRRITKYGNNQSEVKLPNLFRRVKK